jgi:hypothetical protein
MRFLLASGALLLAFSAQASSPEVPIAPAQAVQMAAKAGPKGVRGTFVMQVAGTGKSHGHVFLNSDADYHDPGNLSVNIAPWIVGRLQSRFGAPPETFFEGKQIVVRGTVRRVLIGISDDKYSRPKQAYFQTHVDVLQPSQIDLAATPAR